jgi:nitroreductase
MDNEALMMDLFDAIRKRRSVRKYKSDPVAQEDLKKILEAGRLAPSGGNRQPWSFVVARKPENKKALAAASNNQAFIAEADIAIVVLSDPSVYPKPSGTSSRIGYKQDPMIAIDHMTLAATALGYGTCWIGAFDETEVKKIIKAPENFSVIAVLPVGVSNEDPSARPRKPLTEIVCSEEYGTKAKF